MPRPKLLDPPVEISINLPQSIYAAVMLELTSEITGRVPGGARSQLITQLLRGWLEERKSAELLTGERG